MKPNTVAITAFALITSLATALNATNASATTRTECLISAHERLSEIIQTGNTVRRDIQVAALGTGITASLLLAVGLYQSFPLANLNPRPDVPVSSYRHAPTLTGLALMVLIGSGPGQEMAMEDALRAYRQTERYRCLVLDLGTDRAEEFLADALAGWHFLRLGQKYLSPEENEELQRIASENNL